MHAGLVLKGRSPDRPAAEQVQSGKLVYVDLMLQGQSQNPAEMLLINILCC